MRIPLMPRFKYVCDRCGKEVAIDTLDVPLWKVAFVSHRDIAKLPNKKEGEVCPECFDEFEELTQNFFSEVNKESEDTE